MNGCVNAWAYLALHNRNAKHAQVSTRAYVRDTQGNALGSLYGPGEDTQYTIQTPSALKIIIINALGSFYGLEETTQYTTTVIMVLFYLYTRYYAVLKELLHSIPNKPHSR